MAKEETNKTEINPLIVERADGTYIRVKRVDVHVDYVNADGSPRINQNGDADTGNYALSIGEEQIANFPQETIQGLAAIYDACLSK